MCLFSHLATVLLVRGITPKPSPLAEICRLSSCVGFSQSNQLLVELPLAGNIRDFKATPHSRYLQMLPSCYLFLELSLTGALVESVLVTIRFRPCLQKSLAANPTRSVMRGSGSGWIFLYPLVSSCILLDAHAMPCHAIIIIILLLLFILLVVIVVIVIVCCVCCVFWLYHHDYLRHCQLSATIITV